MAYLDGHLVNMDTLLDTEFGDKNIESSIQNPNDLGLSNDRAIAVGKIGDHHTEEEMCGLLLGQGSRISLDVALLCDLRDGITVHGELDVICEAR